MKQILRGLFKIVYIYKKVYRLWITFIKSIIPFLLSGFMSSHKKMAAVTSQYCSADLLYLILDKLLEPIDHVRFAAVCKEWCSLAKYYNHSTRRWHKDKVPPMLMIPKDIILQENNSKTNRSTKQIGVLQSLPEEKIYDNIELPMSTYSHIKRYCCSCGHGWLAKILIRKRCRCCITLIYPFRKEVAIRLPSFNYLCLQSEVKVMLSTDPNLNSDNYVVIAFCIDDFSLAFIRGGQKRWSRLKYKALGLIAFSDAIFHKDQLYTVHNEGKTVLSIDVTSGSTRKHKVVVQSTTDHGMFKGCRRAYIVESTKGDMFLVRRHVTEKPNMQELDNGLPMTTVTFFKVYKMVFEYHIDFGPIVKHVEVNNIGDEAFFVGDHSYSTAISASSCFGCQPNSIYYIDDSRTESLSFRVAIKKIRTGKYQMARIFNLKDKSISQIYSQMYSKLECITPALWITPPYNGLY